MSARRREELLDLAEQVLEEEGLDDFGVGVLARAAGIRPPSLYKHFAGLDDIESALIARAFRRFGSALDVAVRAARGGEPTDLLAAFARIYRDEALARPQLYRLMTARPLDRERLEPGAEEAGMAALLAVFGENVENHDTARAAWAWAHGLVSLELAERFPPGADVDAAWQVLIDTLAPLATHGS